MKALQGIKYLKYVDSDLLVLPIYYIQLYDLSGTSAWFIFLLDLERFEASI